MTDWSIDPAFLKAAICGLTEVERTNQGWEITLPQAYHTGHAAVVVVSPVGDGFMVHDNSYAAMLVAQMGHTINSGSKSYIEDAVRHYGCELEGYRVFRHCEKQSELALGCVLVGCASRVVADQSLAADKVPIFDFRTKMVTKVTEVVGVKRVRTNEEVLGHLGASYHVSAVVLDAAESRPVAFVEPISSKDGVARRFKEFYDISRNESYAGIERVAVYDDEKAISGPDILLMQEVSNPVRFADSAQRFAEWATLR